MERKKKPIEVHVLAFDEEVLAMIVQIVELRIKYCVTKNMHRELAAYVLALIGMSADPPPGTVTKEIQQAMKTLADLGIAGYLSFMETQKKEGVPSNESPKNPSPSSPSKN